MALSKFANERTKNTSKSSYTRHYNPYLSLRIDPKFYETRKLSFKKLELKLNGREKELRALNEAVERQQKEEKLSRKQRTKEKQQAYFRNRNISRYR